jgi:hypothetical protein
MSFYVHVSFSFLSAHTSIHSLYFSQPNGLPACLLMFTYFSVFLSAYPQPFCLYHSQAVCLPIFTSPPPHLSVFVSGDFPFLLSADF